VLYINRDEVEELLTYDACIEVCEELLTLKGNGEAEDIPRMHLNTGKTNFMILPSMIKSKDVIGMRVYNVGGPIKLMYLLWDTAGTPLAMMDAMWIRDVRTGSIGAIGAKYMARPGSNKVAVLGSGRQARSGLTAHAKLFDIKECTVFSPSKEHREEYAHEMGELTGLDITPVESVEEAIKGTDIIITGTGLNMGNANPLLKGDWLEPGMHLSSIGGRGELADDVVTRSGKVVIDSKAQFPYESQDVTAQVNKGLLSWDDVSEIHEVVVGTKSGRDSDEEITLLKTVGTPLQDLLPAAKVYELAMAKGMGKDLGELFPPSAGWYAMAEAQARA
jgi:ornithine cyclodeaminase/alanine dehydrogenase-like protein (mu-crystallin family)